MFYILVPSFVRVPFHRKLKEKLMIHFNRQKLGPYEVKFMRLYLQHARIYAPLHILHGPGGANKETYPGMKQVEDGQSSIFAFKGRSIFMLEAMVCKPDLSAKL